MEKSKKNIGRTLYFVGIHLLVWTLFICLPLIFASARQQTVEPTRLFESFIFALPSMIMFYLNYLLLAKRYIIDSNKAWLLCLINLAAVILLALFFNEIHELIGQWLHPEMGPPPPPRDGPRHGGPFTGSMVLNQGIFLSLMGAMGVALRVTIDWNTKQVEIEKYKKQKTEAELQNLKMQLNPHFLFNSLNNIYSLAAIDGERTQYFIHSLSSLLRYELYRSNAESVPLGEDIAFVESYCELMKLRYGDEVRVSFVNEIPEDCALAIAPLMFITLAENAFKHGINPSGDSEIEINFCLPQPDTVKCSVKNTNHPRRPDEAGGSGVGLDNLKKRLEYLYSDRYFYQTRIIGDHYHAVLTIKLS